MLALEREPGLAVVEGVAAGLSPVHELGVGPVVLDVARLALLIAGPCVQPLALRDPLRDGGVARETLLGRDAPSGRVTLQAARHALEVPVHARQLTGGDLCGRGKNPRRQRQQDGRRHESTSDPRHTHS